MKAAIITGASHGIGAAVAERFLAEGIKVFGVSRSEPKNPAIEYLSGDVTDFERLQEISRLLKKEKISFLLNAAGIISMNLALTTPRDVTEKIIHVNLLGTIYSCQNFAKLIIKTGSGAILNFSSIAVQLGLKGESIYVASKAGVEGFTYSFAREMADFNITVNAIAPGPIDTGLLDDVASEKVNRVISQQIFSKGSQIGDVADLALMLCSDTAKRVTGEVIAVGGV